ncbi:hypothetical protein [Streptosporangium sp. KLBMP 9127]|nr:hypothetical protein [Streptosporangium sp. KLBMP 9127]
MSRLDSPPARIAVNDLRAATAAAESYTSGAVRQAPPPASRRALSAAARWEAGRLTGAAARWEAGRLTGAAARWEAGRLTGAAARWEAGRLTGAAARQEAGRLTGAASLPYGPGGG